MPKADYPCAIRVAFIWQSGENGLMDAEISAKRTLFFTSPPYYGVTNYFYDQWLRFWLLGGPLKPKPGRTLPAQVRKQTPLVR